MGLVSPTSRTSENTPLYDEIIYSRTDIDGVGDRVWLGEKPIINITGSILYEALWPTISLLHVPLLVRFPALLRTVACPGPPLFRCAGIRSAGSPGVRSMAFALLPTVSLAVLAGSDLPPESDKVNSPKRGR